MHIMQLHHCYLQPQVHYFFQVLFFFDSCKSSKVAQILLLWQTADEYLSGNVRDKLRMAQLAAESHPEFKVNVDALTKAQPRDLEASEIDVRLRATWLAPSIVQQFMMETFQPPFRIR